MTHGRDRTGMLHPESDTRSRLPLLAPSIQILGMRCTSIQEIFFPLLPVALNCDTTANARLSSRQNRIYNINIDILLARKRGEIYKLRRIEFCIVLRIKLLLRFRERRAEKNSYVQPLPCPSGHYIQISFFYFAGGGGRYGGLPEKALPDLVQLQIGSPTSPPRPRLRLLLRYSVPHSRAPV